MNNTNSNEGNTMKRITIFGAIVLATIGTAIAGATPASATNTTTPDTTIVNAPDTTVPETPDTTIPSSPNDPAPNETTIPAPDTTIPPRCPDGQIPQGYSPNDPCGPDDPCVVTNPATGQGTTLWHIVPCEVAVAVVAPPTMPPSTPNATTPNELPATGAATNAFAVLAALFVAVGAFTWWASRRNDGDRMIERLDRTDGAS